MYKIIIILILLIILFYMVRRAARVWIEPKSEQAAPGKDVMVQDPVCKVYVTAGSAIVEEGVCNILNNTRKSVRKTQHCQIKVTLLSLSSFVMQLLWR